MEIDEKQEKILKQFVTNTKSNVFVLRNLPEVIKGALFSRYSRAPLSLRELLLKEFVSNDELKFDQIVGIQENNEVLAIQKAQKFYDRILDGYGDDSIGELGGAHLAAENISMIAAKVIEDARIGGSPLEKSTRYIYFDKKVDGEFLFYKDPTIMRTPFKELYLKTCNHLFETYAKLIPPLLENFEKKLPKEDGVSDGAYRAAQRAKVCDCLRGLLPAAALTNMGVFGNGRFFETLLQKLNSESLQELKDIGKEAQEELGKVIPSFVRRSKPEHRHAQSLCSFHHQMKADLKTLAKQHEKEDNEPKQCVKLIHAENNAPVLVAAALLFAHTDTSYEDLIKHCQGLSQEELERILDGACRFRENRRHKSPRALENAVFTFEICADFGSYRDLQRHRMLTQERKRLTCDNGFWIPPEIIDTSLEKTYVDAMEIAQEAYLQIAKEFPEQAQYVVPMGYNIHWYFTCNLRALQWLCELRSQPQGHATYRFVAQEMAKQIIHRFPQFERFFKYVDYEGYDLGRLSQEIRIHQKRNEAPA
ncbi:MAG: Thymidylate synthase ThyX [Chlamydiae bacterium]|nr:Thymidylate synthase ThyX [Chlamydiota bacterium]